MHIIAYNLHNIHLPYFSLVLFIFVSSVAGPFPVVLVWASISSGVTLHNTANDTAAKRICTASSVDIGCNSGGNQGVN